MFAKLAEPTADRAVRRRFYIMVTDPANLGFLEQVKAAGVVLKHIDHPGNLVEPEFQVVPMPDELVGIQRRRAKSTRD